MKKVSTLSLAVIFMPFFFSVLYLSGSTLQAAVTANFQSNVNLIATGNSVNFLDLTTGDPVSWEWTFVGGTPATWSGQVPPAIYYNTPGEYTVILEVTDADGNVSVETKNAYIDVNDYPTGWDVTQTGSSHLISIPLNVEIFGDPLSYGDFLGVFYLDENNQEKCGGFTIWDDENNKVVTAFGDDITTDPEKEGFDEGEDFIWKVFFSAASNVEDAIVTYNTALPNSDGTFADNGLSSLTQILTGVLEVTATATPDAVCEGYPVQLFADAAGGTENYTYQWSSDPAGFSSTLQDPVVSPNQTTTYSVEVDDGISTVSDAVTVTVSPAPQAEAGSDQSVCMPGVITLSGTADHYSSVLWTSSGSGTFDNSASLSTNYNPSQADVDNGSVQLTLTASPIDPCVTAAQDMLTAYFAEEPSASAGNDQSVCEGEQVSLNGTAENYCNLNWSGGDGSFDDPGSLTPVYTPGINDIANGSVQICIQADACNPCTLDASDCMTVTFQKQPSVSVGADATICEGESISVSGSVENDCGFSWTTSGDGNFSDNGSLTPIYTPGPLDVQAGIVDLCLEADACSPCSGSVSDCLQITIQMSPEADAGTDFTICETDDVFLNGLADNYCELIWTSGGDGNFSNDGVLSPQYFPGNGDIAGGTVELCLTAYACDPCLVDAFECIDLTIQKHPSVNAGPDVTMCEGDQLTMVAAVSDQCGIQWTSTGDGTFSDAGVIDPVYTPGANDIANGLVELCVIADACAPCLTEASDCMQINIQKQPEVLAGEDQEICEGENVLLAATAANHCGLTWNTSGDGTFDENSSLTATYFPGPDDIANGLAELCLTAAACNPCEVDVFDCLDLVIQKEATASAGSDATICEGASYLLSGASASNYSQVQWSSANGTGLFDNQAMVNATYTPSATDIQQGCVVLQISAQPVSPCTVTATDDMELCFQLPPEADAGPDAEICEGDAYLLSGAGAANYQTLQWITDGDGNFDDPAIENPVYTHGTNDLATGSVTLTVVAQPIDPCTGSVQDEMLLSIQVQPEANAGDDATIAEDESYTNTDAAVSGFSNFYWESAGDGVFDDNGILNTTYTPGDDDKQNGTVQLCLTAEPITPCQIADVDCLTLVIGLAPNVYAGPDATICEGNAYALDQATADNYSSILWISDGDGTFSDPTIINPVYYPGTGDELNGSAELCITAQPVPPSTVEGSNCMILNIQQNPEVNAGPDLTICEGEDVTFNDATESNYSAIQWSTTDGSGTFDNTNALKPTYFPVTADYQLGCITISVMALPVDPCTLEATDEMELCFQLLPVADAGQDVTICETGTVSLNGLVENDCGYSWETLGDGTFDDSSLLGAVYTPGNGDIASGSAQLCLHADACAPCTQESIDCLTVTIQPEPVVDAGDDQEICEDDTFQTQATVENACGVLWTTTGDGGFDNADMLLATYFPGADDIDAGEVTLCIEVFPCDPCINPYSDCMTLSVQKNPEVFAGADETICEGEQLEIMDATVSYQSAIQWFSTDGTGTFSSTGIINPVYTPSTDDYTMGCITLGVFAQPESPCTTVAEDYRSLCFQLQPSVSVGEDGVICEGESFTLAPQVSNGCGFEWTTTGDGNFDNPFAADAAYTPGSTDIASGSAELCLSVSACAPCSENVSDCLMLTIQKQPEAYAGEDAGVAEDDTYALSQATSDYYSTLEWTTDGNGTFDDPATLNPVYTPGNIDIANSQAILCLTAFPMDPCLVEATDCMTLDIGSYPSVSAGEDQLICEDQTLFLTGASAQNYQTLLWTSSGEGTFDDPDAENPTYFPGLSDIASGSVELCLEATAIPPATGTVSDCMTVSFQLNPVIDAGPDATVCEGDNFVTSGASGSNYGTLQWATTSGTGEFLNPGQLEATYVPSFLDLISGCITLQVTVAPLDPCTTGTSDVLELCFQSPPEVNAGQDAVICEDGILTLNGSVEAACGFEWSTSGDGTFSDIQDLNATYIPGQIDKMLGFAEICLEADACDPCTVPGSDCMILTIQPAPVANAGANAEICETDNYQLNGTVENACGQVWGTQGDGTFSDASLLNAVYTPGPQEISNGFAELCLTAQPCDPCDVDASDCMLIEIQGQPMAYAGDDQTICGNESLALSEATAENYAELQWSSSGSGNFDNTQSLNPLYTPSPDDIAQECVTLTLEALPINPCSTSATDEMELCFQPLPEIDAGSDVTICAGDSWITNAIAQNACGYTWITNGDGTFTNGNTLNATYHPGPADFANGFAEICITAEACDPCNESNSDCMTIFFQQGPTAYAGPDDGVLAGNAFFIEEAEVENYSSLLWETSGDGTFDDPAALNPTYTHGPGDEANFGVELCLTAFPVDPCQVEAQDCMLLQIGSMPVITAGPDIALCAEEQYLIADASAENFSSLQWTTEGDGTFDDNTVVNPVYTMGPEDLANGSVELCMHAEPVPPATISATDCMVLSVVSEPTASVGDDVTLCGDDPYTLQGTADNYCDIIWTSTGDGEFSDAGSLQPAYTPGQQDLSNGVVDICMEAAPCDPCTVSAIDCLTMTLLEAPEANAGNDVTICENKTVSLTGSVSNNCDFYWETIGDGTFDDISSLTPTYTPGELDKQNGIAEVCLVALPCAPCTTTTTDCAVIIIQGLPQPDPGPDASICLGDSYDLNASLENGCGFLWQTTGDGAFANSGTLTPTYNPGPNDYSNGSVNLMLFAFPCSPCSNFITEGMTLSFVSDPTVNAGADVTICSTEPFTLQPEVQDACGVVWETSGDGTFDDNNLVNATYYPGPADATAGTVELCFTGLPCGSCETPDSDCMTATLIPGQTADAGADATICENQVYQLNGTAENDCGTEWTSGGDGLFDDPLALNAIYTPGPDDISNGFVVITLLADPCPPCENVTTDEMILNFALLPTSFAGADATILSGETYQVTDAEVTNAASFSWSTNGDGVFDDASVISPVYSPGATDIANGSVVLCLTAQPLDPCYTTASDCLTLSIGSPAVAEAGPDATICSSGNFLIEEAFAENFSTLLWTTSGDGTFSDPSIDNPVYFPGDDDILDGTVQLCIEAQPVPPATTGDTDCMSLTIQSAPTANAGANATICENETYPLNGSTENDCGRYWTTSGDGTFDDITLLNATYTPGQLDQQAGTVDLCLVAEGCAPCDDATDCMTLSINLNAEAFAGEDATVCDTDIYQLSGEVMNACGTLWTTNGDGTFSDPEDLSSSYTPGTQDLLQGSAEVCLTAIGCDECPDDQDCMTLFFQPAPTASAGEDVTVCEDQIVQLSGLVENACDVMWTTDGNGDFGDPGQQVTTYAPGMVDIVNGSVTVCLIAGPCDPCVTGEQDCMTITIQSNPVADAGEDATICENDIYQLNGSAENACGLVWTSGGSGVFDDAAMADATYFPSIDDIVNGSVTLCLEAAACNPCSISDSDCLTLYFAPQPTVFAGEDVTVCEDQTIVLEGFAAEACGLTWTTSGDGAFGDPSSAGTTYIPGPQDIANGGAEICLEAFACDPCTGSVESCLNITIVKHAQAFAGEDDEVCAGSVYQLNGDVSDACDWQWTTNGDGGFDDAGSLNAVYTPGTGDIAAGEVEICLEAFSCDPCNTSEQDCISLSIQPEAIADAGEDATVCETQELQLSGQAENACDFYWTSNGDGQFDDVSTENPVYTPGNEDVVAGQVTLCFTAVSCDPCETEITDCITLTILSNPVADAGPDQSICEDQTVDLNGQATDACSVSWSTSGFGSFDDNQSISTVYTPAGFDFGLGEIELCLTVQPCDPCTLPDVDCMTVTILEVPDIFAGEDDAACVDAPYQLDGHAENVSSILWSTSGDGTFDNPEIPDALYTPGTADASAGQVELTLTGFPLDPCTQETTDMIILTLHNCQTSVIPAGWSGISTWVDPLNADVEDIFAPVIDELIILQDMQNSWWPSENINTLGTWNYLQGYKIKVTEEVTLNIPGNAAASNSLELDAGWNLIPVLSSCAVDVETLFAGTDVVIVKQVAGWQLYWPEFGINNLLELFSGNAYYVFMETAGTITFPDCDGLKANPERNPATGRVVPPVIWTGVTPTPVSHVIAIPADLTGLEDINKGDFIGVTDKAGNCFGYVEWTGENTGIAIYGDDPVTPAKDGFEPGEAINFVHFNSAMQSEAEMMVIYDETYHADGTWIENGLSVLKSVSTAGIGTSEAKQQIRIYPNPVRHTLNIHTGIVNHAMIEVLNMQGQLIWSGETNGPEKELDFSTYNNGVYLIRISGEGFSHVERITKQ